MKSANISHLYMRNGVYYYRNNANWNSLRTHCKNSFEKIKLYFPFSSKLITFTFLYYDRYAYLIVKAC